MGVFICLNNSRYKVRGHADLETRLIRSHGFQLIVDSDYERIMDLILKTTNEKGETFCRRLEEGVFAGIMVSYLAGNSIRNNTVLILTSSATNAIEEVESIADIRAVLAFNYNDDDDESKVVDINALCSNQLTKSRGGGLLLTPLISVCNGTELTAIVLHSSPDGVEFYKKKGFENEPDERYPNKMVYILASGGIKRVSSKVKAKVKATRKRHIKMR